MKALILAYLDALTVRVFFALLRYWRWRTGRPIWVGTTIVQEFPEPTSKWGYH